ncbi:MAG TPA: hypothetical protein VK742_13425 [Candidatus Sulfotelmatobacter sp.]|jgi:hypothetical protein|nr:hypothetical protein [Candidatus Sulfotelmatobacter sp.]
MKRLNYILTGAVVVAGIAATFLVRSRANEMLRNNGIALEQQTRQLAALTAENQRLNAQIEQAKTNPVARVSPAAELNELRTRVAALWGQAAEMSARLQKQRRRACTDFLAQGDADLREHGSQIAGTLRGGPRDTGKLNDARVLMNGLLKYADEHDGQLAQNFDLITKYYPPPLNDASESWENAPLSGTNKFEIIFQGNLAELTNIPPHRVAVIRETIPWMTPDGKWARTYGYADGSATIETSDDNFQSWDAQYVVPAPDSSW